MRLIVISSKIPDSLRAILLLVIRVTSAYEQSGVRFMSNCLSSHPLLNPLTLNFNTQIEMMAVDDIGVGAHLVLTASEQATDSAVIWSQQLDQLAPGKTLVNCCVARSVSANHRAVSRMHLLPSYGLLYLAMLAGMYTHSSSNRTAHKSMNCFAVNRYSSRPFPWFHRHRAPL